MDILGDDDLSWILHEHHDPPFPRDILLKKKQRLNKEDLVGSKNLYAEHEKQDWSIMSVIHRTLSRPFHMLAGKRTNLGHGHHLHIYSIWPALCT